MNTKNLISFIALLAVAAIVYFTISTYNSTMQVEGYEVNILTLSKNFDGFKSYHSKGKSSFNNVQRPLNESAASSQFNNNSIKPSIGVSNNSPVLGNSTLSPAYKSKNNQQKSSNSGSNIGGGGFYASSRSSGQGSTGGSSSGLATSNISSPFGDKNTRFMAPPYSGATSVPDPGGDPDDECKDDVIFLPVPDGFWFLISLALTYFLFIFIKNNKQEIITISSKLKGLFLLLPFFFINPLNGTELTYNTSGSFTVPDGITTIKVETWGGGGRGGTRTTNGVGAGGGGGAYSASILSVTPNQSYSYTVGTGSSSTSAGGDSYFNNATTVMAKGGSSCGDNSNTPASGGAASSGYGTTKHNGGNGAIGPNTGTTRGGGGGSSGGAGSDGNYTNLTTSTTTGASVTGGGDGGNGRNVNSQGNGNPGSIPGGGGGGAYRSSTGTRTGGTGANGQIRLTYVNITGILEIGLGGTSTLSADIAGGTWSSDDPSIASINKYSGTVKGVSQGTAEIAYTSPEGLITSVNVTVGLPAVKTFTSGSSYTIPADVTAIKVEVWGGGGRGSTLTSNGVGAGGGGGAYSTSVLSVTPNQSYSYSIGSGSSSTSPGGDTWFSSSSTVMAKGGSSAANNYNTAGAAGGAASSGYGTTKYDGGNGAIGPNTGTTRGGGGGSSGGTSSKGNYTNTSTSSTSGGTITGGGSGGDGRNINSQGPGNDGEFPGGGGGGAYRSGTNQNGGSGANGAVKITYLPAISGITTIYVSDTTTLRKPVSGGSWSSADAGIATINSSTGLVTGVSVGSVTIKFTSTDNLERTITVYVIPKPESAVFWLKADKGTSTTTNGASVTSWDDQSLTGNDATSQTGRTDPTYASTLWNFNPGINFVAGNFVLSRGTLQDDISLFTVYDSEQTTGNASWWNAPALIGNEANGTTADFGLKHNYGNVFFKATDGNNFGAQTSSSFSDGKPKVVFATRKKTGAGGNNIFVYINGTQVAAAASDNVSLTNAGSVGIGGEPTTTVAKFIGGISEAGGKDYLASRAERYVHETYLAIKYGVTLSHDYTRGGIAGDTLIYPIENYEYDIAGLGRNDLFELNQKVSSSSNVASGSSRIVIATNNNFTLSNLDNSRTSLANNKYLVWGHNNVAPGTWTDVPSTNFKRVSRIWRSHNTNNVGMVYFQIDLNSYPTPPSGYYYAVLISDHESFSGSSTYYLLNNTSGTLYSAQVTFPSGTNYFTIAAVLPNYWKGTNSTDWGTATNWTAGLVPATGADIEFATIANNGSAAIKDLILDTNRTIGSLINLTDKKLIIPTGKTLIVNNDINTNNNNRILIQAAENEINGSLIFPNVSISKTILGTVEMWSKGYVDEECNCPNDRYYWQFFGPPVHSYTLSNYDDYFYKSSIRQYDESKLTTKEGEQWNQLVHGSVIEKFKGYEITNLPDPKKVVFEGRLVNDNLSTGELPVTSGSYYQGWHLLSNPYTAAIPVKDIEFGTGMESTVYLFTTGSFNDWRNNAGDHGKVSVWNDDDAVAPGQYLAIPKNLSGFTESTGVIPSMQGFMIGVSNRVSPPVSGKIVSFDYSKLIGNTQKQRAPRLKENHIYTTVTLSNKDFFDKVWLFTNEGCTPGYDNGWDGRKLLDNSLLYFFASQEGDAYQTLATDDINDTYLYFKPTQGEVNYKLHFKHSNTSDAYKQILLYDSETNKTIDITAEGSTYSFVSNKKELGARFKITTVLTKSYTKPKFSAFSVSNQIFVNNYTNDIATMYLYNISGELITSGTMEVSGNSYFPVTLQKGLYIIRAEAESWREAQKIIVR
ncbi:hypothetical protein MASR2M117_10910 [Paludibacter sp.]